MPIQILPATADDYPTLANIQVVSFQNNPLNRLMFPKGNTPANQEVTIGTIQNQAKDSYTHFFKAVDTETGEIAGYSRWAFYLKERSEEEINAPVPKRPEHPEVNVELRNAMVEELEKSKKIVMGRRPHLCMFVYSDVLSLYPPSFLFALTPIYLVLPPFPTLFV